MKDKQKGFGTVIVLVGLLIVSLIAGTGWYVWHVNQKTQQSPGIENSKKMTDSPTTKALDQKEETGTEPKKVDSSKSTTQSHTTNTDTQTPTPAASTQSPTSKHATAYVLYRISADGKSAQLSPVTTTLNNVSAVDVTVDLQCLGACKFKLASDSFNFSNTTTYTSSQKITYTLTKPGEYILYNHYLPGTKFGIKF